MPRPWQQQVILLILATLLFTFEWTFPSCSSAWFHKAWLFISKFFFLSDFIHGCDIYQTYNIESCSEPPASPATFTSAWPIPASVSYCSLCSWKQTDTTGVQHHSMYQSPPMMFNVTCFMYRIYMDVIVFAQNPQERVMFTVLIYLLGSGMKMPVKQTSMLTALLMS